MNAPVLRLYRGYDPRSTTMRKFWTTGSVRERESLKAPHALQINEAVPACMGADVPPGLLQFFDFGLQPYDGCMVLIFNRRQDGSMESATKRLLRVGERWLASCHWWSLPLDWLRPVAIGVLVCEIEFPGWTPLHIRHQLLESDESERAWRAELNGQPEVRKLVRKYLAGSNQRSRAALGAPGA